MPELINGTYVSAIVPISVIPARTQCKWAPRQTSGPPQALHNVILSKAKNLRSLWIGENGNGPEMFRFAQHDSYLLGNGVPIHFGCPALVQEMKFRAE